MVQRDFCRTQPLIIHDVDSGRHHGCQSMDGRTIRPGAGVAADAPVTNDRSPTCYGPALPALRASQGLLVTKRFMAATPAARPRRRLTTLQAFTEQRSANPRCFVGFGPGVRLRGACLDGPTVGQQGRRLPSRRRAKGKGRLFFPMLKHG